MIRRVSFIRRKEGLSVEAFLAHWLGRHTELVRQVPGLRGLRFTPVERCLPEDAAWDGVGETWFDSMADADRAFATEPHRSRLLDDRDLFIGASHSCYVEDHADARPPHEEALS